MSEQQRRTVAFQDLSEVARDVRALQTGGYTAVGNWDLSQVCGHLTQWMQFPMDGFPKVGFPMSWIFACMRVTVGPRTLRKILQEGSMKSGVPTAPATVPDAGGDEPVAVQLLCETIERLMSHEGRFHRSPIFGETDRETLIKLQLIHCTHHLSYLVPK